MNNINIADSLLYTQSKKFVEEPLCAPDAYNIHRSNSIVAAKLLHNTIV